MTTISDSIIEFTTKDCKNNRHQNCAGSWNGFGFEVYCSCICHHKKGEVLESVGGPVTNTIHVQPFSVQPFSVGDTIDNG